MQTERPPYYYLDKLLNILLVDDDPGVRALISDVLKPLGMYSIKTASCAREAQQILARPEHVHLCIFDLGLNDIDNDEYFLLRAFSSRVSFVVFTGSVSPAKGWTARDLGARAIIEKTPDFDMQNFLKKINRISLLNIIHPGYRTVNDTLTASTSVLFDKSPGNVSQWAALMGITDRELRHIWRTHLGANAKIILSIYQMFSAAFACYERMIEKEATEQIHVANPALYKRLEEYYHMHRSTINDFISYGNIATVLLLGPA
jgi:DNA-binding NarL/FixJ family response regulator